MDELFENYLATERENAILNNELNKILALLFDAIETESYINPHGIMSYLKAVYPYRWENKIKSLYAQDDESDLDTD